jgi:23S rRNA pseudouridine1911/1915/1917 synthase
MPSEAVPADLDGERFDRALSVLAAVSRSEARRLIDEGLATRDGEPAAPADRVGEGDVLAFPEPEEVRHEPDPTVHVDVLWEDDVAAVVDKPAGLVVHAGAGRRVPTLAAGLVARWPSMAEVGEPGRWGLVHRLDRDTSGALLVAKTQAALEALADQLRRREVARTYLALAEGDFGTPTGTIDAPIERDPDVPTRRRVGPFGRPSRTHYRVLERFERPAVSLLEVRLETGRTHQIRVHLAAIDHPVVADRVYRRSSTPTLGLQRTWLHAARLGFAHPEDGTMVTVESPLPPELADTLDDLRAATTAQQP